MSLPIDRADRAEMTVTECYELLADDQRRAVIDVLADRQLPVELSDLAAAVAAREEAAESVDRVTTRLHHTHLPKLAGFGVLTYDPDTHRVESFTPLDDEPLA
jgi:predicted transcriptional regulator